MIKKFILLSVTMSIFFFAQSCKEEIVADVLKLEVYGPEDGIILGLNEKIQYHPAPYANWTINSPAGGTVDPTGLLTTGTTEGKFTVTATNRKNPSETVTRSFQVVKGIDLLKDMVNNGGYFLVFRHANASLGSDQLSSKVENWWKSCEPSLARQITRNIGYEQSDSTGLVLKKLRIPFDTSMTSEYCRCKQTVETFKLTAPIKEYKELTYYVYDETNRYDNTMKLMAKTPLGNKNRVIIGHAGFSRTPSPAPLATLQWGDAAIFKQEKVGQEVKYITTIGVGEWMRLSRVLR